MIAGGSGVLGSYIAAELDDRGAHLVIAGRDQARLDRVVAGLGSGVSSQFDIRSPVSARVPIDAALARFGRVDGLVNAAGVVAFGPLESYPEEVIDDLISTNFLGPLHMLSSALKDLEGGFVVNVSGVVAESPFPNMSPYVAAKAGLSALGKSLGRELRRKGILVVDARPPHTETGLANRAIHGEPLRFPHGVAPGLVARVIVEAIEADQREVPSGAFTDA